MRQTFIILCMSVMSFFQIACNKSENNNPSQNEKEKMEANKQLIAEAYSKLNKGDIEGYAEFFAANTKNHGEEVGREGIKFVIADILHTFPDVNLQQVAVFAEGDWIISRDIFKGTFKNKATVPHHGGLLMINEPTNKTFAVQHIHLFKIENNLITEHFASRDDVEMYQQLGIIPPAPAFEPQADTKK